MRQKDFKREIIIHHQITIIIVIKRLKSPQTDKGSLMDMVVLMEDTIGELQDAEHYKGEYGLSLALIESGLKNL